MHISYRQFIILILLAFCAKAKGHILGRAEGDPQQTEKRIVKRADSGNSWGPPVHISSTVLQLQPSPAQSEASASPQYGSSLEHAWKPSGISPGYEAWLDTGAGLQHYQPTQLIYGASAGNIGGNQLGGTAAGNVFSSDSHVASGLHTQIISSGSTQHTLQLSDNVDFNNVADLKDLHYTKSYGR